jgi:hypothetical protein
MKMADYVIFAALICVWTLPWAALGVVMFAPWLASSLFTPFNGFWSGALVLYLVDWLGMPLLLLLAGIAIVTTGRSWRWLVAWVATVATGFAFEYATLPFLISMVRARDTLVGHWHWEMLAWGGCFALLAVVAGVLLASSPGRVLDGRGSARDEGEPPVMSRFATRISWAFRRSWVICGAICRR